MSGLFDYINGNSFLHKLNPVIKIFIAFCFIASCFIFKNIFFILGIICLEFLCGYICGVSKRMLKIAAGLMKISILLFIVQVIFIKNGTPIIGPYGIFIITDEGILFSLTFVLLFISSTFPLALVLSVTKMNDLANSLCKNLKIPFKYTFAITTAIKFVPVFSLQMKNIIEAQKTRGVDFDVKNPFKKLALIFPLCVPLLVSSAKKTEQTAMSATLKGFNLRNSDNGFSDYPIKKSDYISSLCSIMLLCCSIFLTVIL